ncbi:MAG TPA: hypothetical protein VJ721_02645 [Chthoniobacterales bacterium]|nr:hypothetical protein [Chthoniobacterales bacterium]
MKKTPNAEHGISNSEPQAARFHIEWLGDDKSTVAKPSNMLG